MGAELPLPILASVIGVGIPLLLLFVHLGGGSRHATLTEPIVHHLLVDEDPAAEIELLHLDPDAHVALVRTTDGRRFVAWSMESSPTLRELPSGAVTVEGEALRVRLGDPGWPVHRVRLPPDQRAVWVDGAGHAA